MSTTNTERLPAVHRIFQCLYLYQFKTELSHSCCVSISMSTNRDLYFRAHHFYYSYTTHTPQPCHKHMVNDRQMTTACYLVTSYITQHQYICYAPYCHVSVSEYLQKKAMVVSYTIPASFNYEMILICFYWLSVTCCDTRWKTDTWPKCLLYMYIYKWHELQCIRAIT